MNQVHAAHSASRRKARTSAIAVNLFQVAAVRFLWALTAGVLMSILCAGQSFGAEYDGGWKLRLHDTAIIRGEQVTLGEIAEPVGPIPPESWAKLAPTVLWPAPPEGRPMNMTRPKVQQAMASYVGELSSLCLYPASMTLQRGGIVLREEELRTIVVKTLTATVRAMPGEADMQDFRLPTSVFLANAGQRVELEGPVDLVPGRVNLRFAVKEVDGSIVRRLTGSVFVDQWIDVPCASVPLNRDESLGPERVTFVRKNLAHMREIPWDGRGGPWRMTRAVGIGQPIYQTDVAVIPAVRKGAVLTLVYEGKNFMVSLPGEALSDGAAGESIMVRNLQSKKQLRATVRDGLTAVVR